MSAWRWVDPAAVIEYNADLGGRVLNQASVLSAVARPPNLAGYQEADAAALAAAYAVGLVRNHGFVDGNKRTAWVTARAFLKANGYRPSYRADEVVTTMVALAGRQLTEAQLARWFRERL